MIKQIIKRFMSLPMKLKLFSFGFSLIFVSTSLSAVAVYQVTSNVIRRNSLQYTDEIMAQSQNYLDEKFKTLILKTNYLHFQINGTFHKILYLRLSQQICNFGLITGRNFPLLKPDCCHNFLKVFI